MEKRTGDWRDLFRAPFLALDGKKLLLGLAGTVLTIVILALVARSYGIASKNQLISDMGNLASGRNLLFYFMSGTGHELSALGHLLPLFNPLHGGFLHFVLSVSLYVLLLGVWTFCGAVITRLSALRYGRDEWPALRDGLELAQAKRSAYFFAPVTPLLGVVLFAFINTIVGLIASIPAVGGFLSIFLIIPVLLPLALIVTFIIVLGVLSFGLMLPMVSIGGKDAFEGWSSAYSYVLWGLNRFICYTLLAGVIGATAVVAAWALSELFILTMVRTVGLGLVGGKALVTYSLYASDGSLGPSVFPFGPSIFPFMEWPVNFGGVCRFISGLLIVIFALGARALVVAYAFSYFFSANTIICLLLRKHVDRIEIDQIYEHKPEEEAAEEKPEEEEAPEPAEEKEEPQEEEAPAAAEEEEKPEEPETTEEQETEQEEPEPEAESQPEEQQEQESP